MGALEIKEELRQFIENSDDTSIIQFYEIIKDFIAKNKRDLSPMAIEELNSKIDKSEEDIKNGKVVAYNTKGEGFTKKQYIKHINSISNSVKNGANKNTTTEVKRFILNS